ncbi:MAG: hypothetical protein CMK59_00885 [Proteobacteria bacterium]|nr:hypothetical protein [Pseudomonadota bacterium]
MSFHYTREPGKSGRILRDNGTSKGLSLPRLILNGSIPFSVSFEILGYVADILHQAEKLNTPHGDILIRQIKINETGCVSIDDFGRPRKNNNTPEGVPSGPGDVYGLGVIVLSLLSYNSKFHPIKNKNSDGTQEGILNEIITQMLSINWGELQNQPWLEQIQEFVLSLLSFVPEERPQALDVANVFFELLPLCEGPCVQEFLQNNKELFITVVEESESLLKPQSVQSPMVEPLSLTPDSSQGAETGLWPKQKIKNLLKKDVPQKGVRKKVNIPQKSPNPKRTTQRGLYQSSSTKKQIPSKPPNTPPKLNLPPKSPKQSSQQSTLPKFSSQPFESAVVIQPMEETQSLPPKISVGNPRPPLADPPKTKNEKIQPTTVSNPKTSSLFSDIKISQTTKYLIIGGFCMMILCTGLLGVLGAYWYSQKYPSIEAEDSMSETVPTKQIEDMDSAEPIDIEHKEENTVETPPKEDSIPPQNEQDDEKIDESTAKEENTTEEKDKIISIPQQKKSPTPKKSPPKKKTTKKKTSSKKKSTKKKTAEEKDNQTTIVEGSSSFRIQFRLPQLEGKITCGDGQSVDFIQSITMSFRSQQVCRIEANGVTAIYTASSEKIVNCRINNGGLICQ